jgi:hypothetical protein
MANLLIKNFPKQYQKYHSQNTLINSWLTSFYWWTDCKLFNIPVANTSWIFMWMPSYILSRESFTSNQFLNKNIQIISYLLTRGKKEKKLFLYDSAINIHISYLLTKKEKKGKNLFWKWHWWPSGYEFWPLTSSLTTLTMVLIPIFTSNVKVKFRVTYSWPEQLPPISSS